MNGKVKVFVTKGDQVIIKVEKNVNVETANQIMLIAENAKNAAQAASVETLAAAAGAVQAKNDVLYMYSFPTNGNLVYFEPDGEGILRLVPEAKWGRGLPLPIPVPSINDAQKSIRVNSNITAFEYVSAGGNSTETRTLRRTMMQQHNFGLRKYNWTSVPAVSGTTGAGSIAVCRINVHGVGFQGVTGSRTFAKLKITAGCLDRGITYEMTLYRDGNTWRIDKQSYMGGSSGENSYYAYNRGGDFKPNNDGWLLMTGQTENNSAITEEHSHYIGASGAEWAYPPVFWPSQSAWDITHYHPVLVPYKINKTISGTLNRSYEDSGSSPAYLDVAVYTDAGVHIVSPYVNHQTEWIELRVLNLPQVTGIRPLVSTTLEFADCNHTVWFYDSEKTQWESPPVVAITGDSAAEGTDLRDLVFFNYSDAYYGDVYRHAWSEKRGYWNYAWDGSMMIEMIDRMRIVDGELQFNHKIRGWSESKGFTHVILGVGCNEAVERVLRRRGRTNRQQLISWDGNYMNDIISIVDKIAEATARVVQPVIMLFSNIVDAQAIIDTGGAYGPLISMDTGLEVEGDYMTVQDWEDIAVEFGLVTDALYEYAVANNIPVIDWYTLSEWYRFNDDAGTFMTTAGHYTLNGLLTVANYADVKRRI